MDIPSLRKTRKRRRLPKHTTRMPPGSSPGLLQAAPEQLPSRISVLAYGPEGCVEGTITGTDDLQKFADQWPNLWIHVAGLKDVATIEQLGFHFGLHRLVLEDILNVSHRAKVEDYDQYLFIIAKTGTLADQFETEHFSMVLREKLLITFQEKSEDCFHLVRERIRSGFGRIRQQGTDYLCYALLDAIVDSYYPILEKLNHQLDQLEADVVNESGKGTIPRIHHVKMDLLYLHRAAFPMRDVINMLTHDDNPFIGQGIMHYLRDCHDQTIQITELTEFYRDVAAGLMNTYLAYSGHKMNEIMKVLTMISAIFIPLSFIVGIYGMNFNTEASPYNMPELHWAYGYPMVLSFMALVAFGMLLLFQKRGWLTPGSQTDSQK